MFFLSTKDTREAVNSEKALIYSTQSNSAGLFFPKNLLKFQKDDILSKTEIEIFIDVFSFFLGDLFSKTELTNVYEKITSKFKNNQFFKLKKILNFELCSLTEGQSSSFKDIPYIIISEFLSLYQVKYNKQINLLHIGDLLDLEAFSKATKDKGFKRIFLFNEIDSEYAEFTLNKLEDKDINIRKIETSNEKFYLIKKDIYFQKFLNESCQFSIIDDFNFFNSLGYFFIFILIYKKYNRELSFSFSDNNNTMLLASYLLKNSNLEIDKTILVNYKNDLFKNLLQKSRLRKDNTSIKEEEFSIFSRNKNSINLERILYLCYNLNSTSLNRSFSFFEKGEEAVISMDILNKLKNFILPVNLEDSSDLFQQILSFIKNENVYIDQYSAMSIIGQISSNLDFNQNDLIVNFELYNSKFFVNFISRLIGFKLDLDVPWNKTSDKKKEKEDLKYNILNGNLESISDYILNTFSVHNL